MRTTRTRLVAVLVAVTVLIVAAQVPAGAAKQKAAVPDPAATLQLGNAATVAIATWDANTYPSGQSYFQAMTLVYDRLVLLSGDSKELRPMLAQSWKWDSTNTQVTFNLRKDVKFWDGTQFTADVAVANLKRAAGPGGVANAALAKMTDVSAVDANTLKLTFSTPDPAVINIFTNYAGMMMSTAALSSPDKLKTAPAGSGPYKWTSTGADLVQTFERNDGYWDKTHVWPAKVTIANYTDENARINAVREGKLDWHYVTSQTYNTAASDPSLQIVKYDGFNPLVVYLNDKVAPLDKPQVRQAVNMALNRPAFDAAQNNLCSALDQPFPKGTYAYDPKVKTKYDVAAAKKLVSDAGASGATIKTISFIAIEPQQTAANIVQAQLKEIGLNLELVPTQGPLVRATWRTGGYGMFVATNPPGTSIDPTAWLDQYAFGIDNPGTRNPTLQSMSDKARALPLGSKERTTAFQEIDKFLVDNPIWISICSPTQIFIGPKRVIGLDSIPNAAISSSPDLHLLQVAKSK